jgi:DNA-directed RNA polymerase subunit beta'
MEKGEIRRLISWFIFNHGTASTTQLVERLKILGFYHATNAGVSLSVDDLKIPPSKKWLLEDAEAEIQLTERKFYKGYITAVERFQKLIDTWHSTSETLKDEVVEYFVQTDRLNPVYMMAFSGARGNLSQVRQLVGMRGLMSDPQGQIIDLPIRSNFREGLTVTEYIISCYGARKGLVDTALRTADSGYLTRRLVDVAQHVIVRETDCGTMNGISITSIRENEKIIFSLEERILGRVLAQDILFQNNYIARRNQDISASLASQIIKVKKHSLLVRSPLTCKANRSVCQYCYGWSLAYGNLVDLGEAVGIVAAQSIGEPGTQLTMRTFHTGGVFTGNIAQQIRTSIDGKVSYSSNATNVLTLIRTRHGEKTILTTDTFEIIISGTICHKLELPPNTILFVQNGENVRSRQLIAEISISKQKGQTSEIASKYVASDLDGEIYFENLVLQEKKIDSIYGTRFSRAGQFGGLIWVLAGSVFDFLNESSLNLKSGDYLEYGSIFTQEKLTTVNGGTTKFTSKLEKNFSQTQLINHEICILNSITRIENIKFQKIRIFDTFHLIFDLHFKKKEKVYCYRFLADNSFNILYDIFKLGTLVTNAYTTQTGGLIYYSNIVVGDYDPFLKGYEILKGGSILFIPETNYRIAKKDLSSFIVNNQYIDKNTFLTDGIYSQHQGLIELISENEIEFLLKLKYGKLIFSNHSYSLKTKILQPGEEFISGFLPDELVQIEILSLSDFSMKNSFCDEALYLFDPNSTIKSIILIRPISQYHIDQEIEGDFLELTHQTRKSTNIKLIPVICYKDGEFINSNHPIELITISLVNYKIGNTKNNNHIENKFILDNFRKNNLFSKVDLNFSKLENDSLNLLNENSEYIGTIEIEQFEKFIVPSINLEENFFYKKNNQFLLKEYQYSSPSNELLRHNFLLKSYGHLRQENNNFDKTVPALFLNQNHFFTLNSIGNSLKIGDLYEKEFEIFPGIRLPESGQLIQIQGDLLTFRIARPYLVSSEAILHVNHGDLIKSGDTLVMLIYEQSKTGDIIQGLPRIEELLEARRTKGLKPLPNNLHARLEFSFSKSIQTYGLHRAVRKSLEEIQLFLVNEIQLVYKAQGVNISDKHVEIIVRQMTSKVLVEEGGDTTLLPGELIEINRIENLNRNVSIHAQYKPVVLGITKASLNTDSFISAASFQETTRVLTKSAIEGKTDWLRGLKENVIIGRLIPAGTGFNEHEKMASNMINLYNDLGYLLNPISDQENSRYKDIFFDDIILNSKKDYLKSTLRFSTTKSFLDPQY